MLHGPQQGVFDLRFELPAVCAESLEQDTADLGLVPVIEVERQGLQSIPGLGIASDGAVRSILLISKVRADEIESVAMDRSSRTSIALARIVLAERYGVRPVTTAHGPSVEAMLAEADAALIIGDPALRHDIRTSHCHIYDLGLEWKELTALPMVYAVWDGRAGRFPAEVREIFQASYEFGRERLDEIVGGEAAGRGFAREVAREYLTSHIDYELTARHDRGMARFLELARKHDAVLHTGEGHG